MKKILFALIFVLAGTNAFAMTFKVGDNTIDLYASVRAFTVFNYTDAGDRSINCQGGAATGAVERNCSQFVIGLQPNSRAGIRWTQGDFFIHNEWGTGGSATTPTLNLRLLYGDYKFAGGEKGRIRIGQIAPIANTSYFYDRKLNGDNALQGFGTLFERRRLGINYEIGGFSVSAFSMRQDSSPVTGAFAGAGLSNIAFTEIIPRFEAAYKVSSLTVAGSYVKGSIIADRDENRNNRYHVDAGHIAVAANPQIGNNARLIASGFYSVNAGLYQQVSIGGGFDDNHAVSVTDGTSSVWALPSFKSWNGNKPEFYNTSVYGGAVAIVVDKFEAGFGIQSAANDSWKDEDGKVANQTGMGVYANYKLRVANNLRITPEIGYYHSGNLKGFSNVKDTRGFQVGVQFRFDI